MAKRKTPTPANPPSDGNSDGPADSLGSGPAAPVPKKVECVGFSLKIVQDFVDPSSGQVQSDIYKLLAVGKDDGVTYTFEPKPISSQQALADSLLDRISKADVLPGWKFMGIVDDPDNNRGKIVK